MIILIAPQRREELSINKSTLRYQQNKIKEGKEIKLYDKTAMKIQ
jgi:hypothetical protein